MDDIKHGGNSIFILDLAFWRESGKSVRDRVKVRGDGNFVIRWSVSVECCGLAGLRCNFGSTHSATLVANFI
jgi:hypothetical protein